MYTIQVYEMPVTRTQGFIALAGRILLSSVFLAGALMKIMDPSSTITLMIDKGLPLAPLALGLAVFIELLGGLMLLTGAFARQAALMLIVYLVPVTLIFHNTWSVSSFEVPMQLTMVLKNLAIMGGLFMVSAFGPGALVVQREKPTISRRVNLTELPDTPAEKQDTGRIQPA